MTTALPSSTRAAAGARWEASCAVSKVDGDGGSDRSDAMTSGCIGGPIGLGEADRDAPGRRILVVEDAPELAALIAGHLRELAADVEVCHEGGGALELMRQQPPDLVVLDIGLPGLTGLDICRTIRAEGLPTLVLMLSGRGSELDRIVGLEFGADDYVVKPFGMLELLARIRALFRRVEHCRAEVARPGDRITAGELTIDPTARQVVRGDAVLPLTEKEFDLLHLFAQNPGRVYARAQLLDLVWGYGSNVYEYTVTTHINRLRRKIEPDPARPRLIQTVWGLGYRLNAHLR
jgi:DNA-binding response OmpR family regulator